MGMGHNKHDILVVTGPTASGKSAWALDIAQKSGGVILNADSMQVYRDIPILAACPDAHEKAQAEHRLYEVMDGAQRCSVAVWLRMVIAEIYALRSEGRLPILVGGTGMYIKSLMDGLSQVPDIDAQVRTQVRQRLHDEGYEAFHTWLRSIDPVMGARLNTGDGQRMLRAAEVMLQTGKSLTYWHEQPLEPAFPDAQYRLVMMDMPRDVLYQRINLRFERMVETGALEEVAALMRRTLPDDAPILRAQGVPELAAYLRGEMSMADALDKGKQYTRNYAKRQLTWMRQQFPQAERVS